MAGKEEKLEMVSLFPNWKSGRIFSERWTVSPCALLTALPCYTAHSPPPSPVRAGVRASTLEERVVGMEKRGTHQTHMRNPHSM